MTNLTTKFPPKSLHHMRGSVFLLCTRIFFTGFFLDSIYGAILLFLLYNPISGTYASYVLPTLYILHSIKFLTLMVFIIVLVLRWATTNYYMSEHQLIVRKGIIKTDEVSYELTHVRSVELDQSIIGSFFNYGNIKLVLAVSGYHEEVTMHGLGDPKKYEHILREYIESSIALGVK